MIKPAAREGVLRPGAEGVGTVPATQGGALQGWDGSRRRCNWHVIGVGWGGGWVTSAAAPELGVEEDAGDDGGADVGRLRRSKEGRE